MTGALRKQRTLFIHTPCCKTRRTLPSSSPIPPALLDVFIKKPPSLSPSLPPSLFLVPPSIPPSLFTFKLEEGSQSAVRPLARSGLHEIETNVPILGINLGEEGREGGREEKKMQ